MTNTEGGKGGGDKKNKIRLWATKVSFSCRHPTDISTLCEVTFSFYLPCHMTQVIKNQEDERQHDQHFQT